MIPSISQAFLARAGPGRVPGPGSHGPRPGSPVPGSPRAPKNAWLMLGINPFTLSLYYFILYIILYLGLLYIILYILYYILYYFIYFFIKLSEKIQWVPPPPIILDDYTYIYIYINIKRERERDIYKKKKTIPNKP